MGLTIDVTSEIGALKKVMLHRPGKEVENLVPEYLGRLLFDDIPYIKVAVEEHDAFAQLLRHNGVEVLYLENLAADAICNDTIKTEFINEFLTESGIVSKKVFDALKEYLIKMPPQELIYTVMAGIRKEVVSLNGDNLLSELAGDEYAFYLDPMPNLYFTRDPAAAIGRGISINRMNTEARRRETLFIKYIYKYNPLFSGQDIPLWYNRDNRFSIEGGDQLVLSSSTIAIGCSERTSPEGIESFASNLFDEHEEFKRILVFDIPKCRAFMHLDTVFTMIDFDKFTIHPGISPTLQVFEITKGSNGGLNIKNENTSLKEALKKALHLPAVQLIECGGGDRIIAGREQWNDGSNTLAIAPGTVITYDRNYVTNDILDTNGIKVLPIKSSELSRGRGGPRCMSMPLNRERL
jgi:arginine deiminase